MKKLVSMLLCIIMLITLFGCTANEKEATVSEYEKITEIFSNLCNNLNIEEEIAFPTFKKVSQEKVEEISGVADSVAVYDNDTRIIYVVDMDSAYSEAVIAHELTHYINHYLSEFSVSYGFDYYVTKDVKCGFYLTEGITHYIASKLYAMPKIHIAYPFETMIAEQLAAIIGEDELIELFLFSDIETLKSKFNNIAYSAGLKDEIVWDEDIITPFDSFCIFLDLYSIKWISDDLMYQKYADNTLLILKVMVENTDKVSEFDTILNKLIDCYPEIYGFLKT